MAMIDYVYLLLCWFYYEDVCVTRKYFLWKMMLFFGLRYFFFILSSCSLVWDSFPFHHNFQTLISSNNSQRKCWFSILLKLLPNIWCIIIEVDSNFQTFFLNVIQTKKKYMTFSVFYLFWIRSFDWKKSRIQINRNFIKFKPHQQRNTRYFLWFTPDGNSPYHGTPQ